MDIVMLKYENIDFIAEQMSALSYNSLTSLSFWLVFGRRVGQTIFLLPFCADGRVLTFIWLLSSSTILDYIRHSLTAVLQCKWAYYLGGETRREIDNAGFYDSAK